MDETEQAEAGDDEPRERGPGPRGEPSVADRIGRYPILRRLGAGAMGVVFAAYDEQLDRKVAIKLLRPRANMPTNAGARLQREAQGLARLSHANVVTIYEVGEHQGAVYMAMEFVAGQTLGDWLAQAPRTRADILAAFEAAGRGLAAAHAARLVHRDFKPDNVMIGEHGQVKVMDFGLVRAEGESELLDTGAPALRSEAELEAEPESETEPERLGGELGLDETLDRGSSDARLDHVPELGETLERSSSRSHLSQVLTRTGSVMGTPAYMAPEQHRGQPTDARSDQFSFCVALWEALCGERPFAGETVASLTFNVLQGRISEPPAKADMPGWLRRVLERGLALEPAARWPSMDALLDALRRDPSRRRTLVISTIAAVAVAAGAVIYAQVQAQQLALAAAQARRETIARCELDARESLAAVWNDERRARGQQAFAASKLVFASEAWTRSAALLDSYGEQLSQARAQLCIDTGLRDDADAEQLVSGFDVELAQQAQGCLDEQQGELDTLVQLLVEADDTRILEAVSSVNLLPLVSACTDARALAQRLPPPEDPQLRARVEAVRADLARAHTLELVGDLDDAVALAEAALRTAQALGWQPLIAAALYRHGDLIDQAGDYAGARESFEQALYLAAQVGDDVLALDAVIELVQTVGYDLDDPEDGLRLAKLAEILLARTGATGSLNDARLSINVGTILGRQGKVEQSLAAYTRALELQQRLLPANHPTLAIALNNIGTCYARLGKLELGIEQLERSLKIREASYPAEHPRLGVAYQNLGMAFTQQGEYDKARAAIDKGLAITRANLPADHPDIAQALASLGAIEFEQDHSEAALDYFEQALQIRAAKLPPEHLELAESHRNVAGALFALGRVEPAFQHYRRAVEIREANLPSQVATLVELLGEFGKSQGLADLPRDAVITLTRAQELARSHADEVRPLTLALVQWYLALALWDAGPRTRKQAIETMRESYLSYAEHGKPSDLPEMVAWLEQRGAKVPQPAAAP